MTTECNMNQYYQYCQYKQYYQKYKNITLLFLLATSNLCLLLESSTKLSHAVSRLTNSSLQLHTKYVLHLHKRQSFSNNLTLNPTTNLLTVIIFSLIIFEFRNVVLILFWSKLEFLLFCQFLLLAIH